MTWQTLVWFIRLLLSILAAWQATAVCGWIEEGWDSLVQLVRSP